MDSDEDAKIARVENWLVENVRVIAQANELTLSDFTYNCKSYNGEFSISVNGEVLEGGSVRANRLEAGGGVP